MILLGKIFEGKYTLFRKMIKFASFSFAVSHKVYQNNMVFILHCCFFSHVISVEITWNNTLPCVRGAAGLPPLYNLLNTGKTEICVASGCIFCASVKMTFFDIEQWGENCHSRHAPCSTAPRDVSRIGLEPSKAAGHWLRRNHLSCVAPTTGQRGTHNKGGGHPNHPSHLVYIMKPMVFGEHPFLENPPMAIQT